MNKDDDFYGVLNSEHNILFMSATPRVYEMEGDADDHYQRVFGTIIPSMSFRYAIENKYICDFKIWLPFISSDDKQLNNEITRVLSVHDINPKLIDKCNFLLLSLSNTGSMKCIIYCMDTKEIAELIKALNISNEFHQFEYDVSQITCSDSEISRKEILNNFATSYKRQLLFSVRILDEGIDIPSCDSIFITFPSKSKIRTIQRMNRCTRIDKSHPFKIDDIFIWCDEYHEMLNTLCELKDYDPLFKERIVISDIDYYGNMNDRKSWNDDKEVLDDLIYKVDTRAYDLKGWGERLLDLREYIIENKKFPSVTSSDSYVKSLGMWRNSQQWNYNNKEKKMKIGATNRDDWSDLMAEFEELFLSNELLLSNDEKWKSSLATVENYVKANNKLPPSTKNDPDIELGRWLNKQQRNCRNEENIMKNAMIRDVWREFIDKYKEFFLSNDEKWKSRLAEVENYIKANNKLPPRSDNDPDIKSLSSWLNNQQRHYRNEEKIMKNAMIRDLWREFIDEYEEFFLSYDEKWKSRLAEVENHIKANNKLPFRSDNDPDIKSLGEWLHTQQQSYKYEENIMKNAMIRDIWREFIDKYEVFFLSNDEKWESRLAEVESYVKANNKLPPRNDNDPDIKSLGEWLYTQQRSYKHEENIMKNAMIRDIWREFIDKNKNALLPIIKI
jgi:type I site-specific restriction endonuclease